MRNSSYSFMPILLKYFGNFTGVLVMVWFGYYPQIIFGHFFNKLNLVIFHALFLSTEVNREWIPRVCNSYSFYTDFLKLPRCFGHGLKMCMWFGYSDDRQIISVTILAIFQVLLLSK